MTDQQFAEAMSCRMGKQFINTPVMDSLAANGMLFTRAYVANPLCMPSRNSIFTGRYPHETEVTANFWEYRLDPEEFVSVGSYFKEAGYETAYFGKWHLCFDQKDVATHGFDSLVDTQKGGAKNGGPDVRAADAAVEFLARKHAQPFLLVASFVNPHDICQWARRLAGRKEVLPCGEIGEPPPLAQLPPAPTNLAPPKNEPDGVTIIRKASQVEEGKEPVAKFTAEDWRKLRWGYYRMIEKVDAEIGRVLEALRKAGLDDNTLIVFTSDHGECAGAHGFNQKRVFYEESARVPLIVAWKGKTIGGTCTKLVNTGIDILPTLLDCAGMERPRKLTGHSVWPLALGKPVSEWRDFVVVQNNLEQTGEVDGFKPTMEGRMVRTDRYKYCIYSRGNQRESLVDMQADPGEIKDLATDPAHRKTLLEHRELLAKFSKDHNDPLAAQFLANDAQSHPFRPQAAAKIGKRIWSNGPPP